MGHCPSPVSLSYLMVMGGLNCGFPKYMSFRVTECDLIWTKDGIAVRVLRWGHLGLGWALKPMISVLTRDRWGGDTQRHREDSDVQNWGRDCKQWVFLDVAVWVCAELNLSSDRLSASTSFPCGSFHQPPPNTHQYRAAAELGKRLPSHDVRWLPSSAPAIS